MMGKKMRIPLGKGLAATLILTLVSGMLAGCGEADRQESGERIELVEPISASVSTETADRRNLYVYDILEGAVYPEITEYSFKEDASFGEYYIFPGESVKSGTVLAKADLTDRNNRIASLQSRIDDLNVSYSESAALYRARIKTLEETNAHLDSTVDYGKIMIQENLFSIERLEIDLAAETAIYELDLEYYQSLLNDLKKENAEDTIRAAEDGIVVAIDEDLEKGTWIGGGTAVIAVAEDGDKYFRCTYLPEKTVAKYTEMYVVVNGLHYEAEYLPYDSDDYNRLTAKGESVYTIFRLADPEGTLKDGDTGIAVLLTGKRENVLAVPKESIHRDESGDYVNTVKDGQVVKAYVEIGLTDGVYTEILDGLQGGELIQLTEYRTYPEKTEVLERRDYGSSYSGNGSFVYPDVEQVTNDLEYGTVTLTEVLVEKYQTVQKGDVIATIQVESDPVALAEQELRLQRLQEKLADAQKELETLDLIEVYDQYRNQRTALNNTVASLQRQIDSAEKTLNRMKKDYGTKSLKAPISGMVTKVTERLAGAVLSSGETVAAIAAPETVYLNVPNAKNNLQYGHHLTVTYEDENGSEQQAFGEVVTVTPSGLSNSLKADYVYVRLEGDAAAVMAPVEAKHLSPYLSKVSYAVESSDKVIENVVIVPLKAVTVVNDLTYVTVVNEDGSRTMRSFIAGGYSTDGYWVVEGLEEGMTVCLD